MILVSNSNGSNILLNKNNMTIGRSSFCDVVLKESYVSWNHLRIFKKKNKTYLREMGSLNGIYVNGQQVFKQTIVKSGDTISIGDADASSVISFTVSSTRAFASAKHTKRLLQQNTHKRRINFSWFEDM